MLRDKALEAYREWQCGHVESPTWKAGFCDAHRITREACFDLKHVFATQDATFYTDKGVKLGIAHSWISDIPLWARALEH